MIAFKIDTSQIRKLGVVLDEFGKDQVPFATARGLTQTAQDARAAIATRLADDFTIRANWVARGIRIQVATKHSLESAVGSVDRFMEMQATGGEREGRDGKRVAVPEAARKTPSSITRPSKWPGKLLLDRKRYFAKPIGSGDAIGVFKRLGRDGRAGVQLWYVLAKSSTIQARWPFEAIVDQIARERLNDNIVKMLNLALKDSWERWRQLEIQSARTKRGR